MKLQRICRVSIFSMHPAWRISSRIPLYWTFTRTMSHRKSMPAFTDTQFSWLHYVAAHVFASKQASKHSPGWKIWSGWWYQQSHAVIWRACFVLPLCPLCPTLGVLFMRSGAKSCSIIFYYRWNIVTMFKIMDFWSR